MIFVLANSREYTNLVVERFTIVISVESRLLFGNFQFWNLDVTLIGWEKRAKFFRRVINLK